MYGLAYTKFLTRPANGWNINDPFKQQQGTARTQSNQKNIHLQDTASCSALISSSRFTSSCFRFWEEVMEKKACRFGYSFVSYKPRACISSLEFPSEHVFHWKFYFFSFEGISLHSNWHCALVERFEYLQGKMENRRVVSWLAVSKLDRSRVEWFLMESHLVRTFVIHSFSFTTSPERKAHATPCVWRL